MKIVNYGENFEIYGDNLKTFDKLPAATYKINFHMMSGFSLVKVDDFKTIEDKIYGNHKEKIQKVLRSYDNFNRSLGTILSGEKGMGKSLFVQLLAEEVIAKGMPVIIVSKPYKGVADFIDKIDQEALILFDEFEKVFSIESDQSESQNDLLGLFDGTSQKKRLYAVTVNKLHRVSEFMLSRTGRFHYHIQFDYPNAEEIEIYLKDKVESKYYGEIKHVVSFANKVKLNYDSLRAIAFELNEGYKFNAAIGDLNILSSDVQSYDFKVEFSNGKTESVKGQRMNMFSERVSFNTCGENGDWFSISFNPLDIKNDAGNMFINGENVALDIDNDNEVYTKDVKVKSVAISLHRDFGVNFRMDV